MEKWKPVSGYEKEYKVSDKGRVYSRSRVVMVRGFPRRMKGRIRKFGRGTDGYFFVPLSKNGIVRNHSVHRLVAKAFLPNPLNKKEVNHKDGDKSNNNAVNLEWATPKENSRHAWDNGFVTISDRNGRNNGNSKLTFRQVKNILNRMIDGEGTMGQIAKDFFVHTSLIGGIKAGRHWAVRKSRKLRGKVKILLERGSYHLWLRKKNGGQGGENNPRAKLTWKEVRRIKALLSDGRKTQSQIAKEFSVCVQTINNIFHGKVWAEK